jgi:hypothetical protein
MGYTREKINAGPQGEDLMQFTKSTLTRSMWNGAIIATVLVFAVGSMAAAADLAELKPTVSFTGAPASAPILSTFTVTATDTSQPSNIAVITASGSCTISGDAVTMTKSTGTCTLKASWPADGNYLAATATQKTTATIGYTESVIYPFGSQNDPDGLQPYRNGLITDKAGNLYGATITGGGGNFGNDGAVFELSPVAGGGWQETVLYLFNSQSTGYNGYSPAGTLAMDSKGNLYGTTISSGDFNCVNYQGNAVGCGTVYELSPTKTGFWTPTLIYRFTGGATDGFAPWAGVTLGNTTGTLLYGTTAWGGSGGSTAGTIYELAYTRPTKENEGGWKETVLYNFADGTQPSGGLLLKGGDLYGSAGNFVYELEPGASAWTFSTLYQGANAGPQFGTPAMDSEGNLYGAEGNSVWELVYSPTTKTYTSQTLYTLNPADGGDIQWGPILYKNSLYATTGGQYDNTCGTAFQLTYSAKTGWQKTDLWQFTGNQSTSQDVCEVGVNQLIVDTKGNLYGMGPIGSSVGYGGVYEISPLK